MSRAAERTESPLVRWAASGALALTGDPDCQRLAPATGIVERIEAMGPRLGVDALSLLGERAAVAGLQPQGTRSCGGASHLVASADGWMAVTLARPDDVDLVPAWLEVDPTVTTDCVEAITRAARRPRAADLVARARWLGLPVARVGEVGAEGTGVIVRRCGDAPPLVRPPRVIDLSALWAGPLCAQILGAHGADVVKVESTSRPDGARLGPPAFFDLLHAGHRSVALDFTTDHDRSRLHDLLAAADIVIEASRPRALRQLGIDADALVRSGPRIWVSITGYGRTAGDGRATAFGDDAAAAGGLVAWTADGSPRFMADAVADPLAGLAGAGAALDALHTGGRWLIDVGMARVAAAVAGPDADSQWTTVAATTATPPRARAPAGKAPALGADTRAVLHEFGVA